MSGQQLREKLDQLTPLSSQSKISESSKDFPEITLTDEEVKEALRAARETKYYLLKRVAYLESLNAPKAVKLFTADEVEAIFKKELVIDPENEEVVRLLCFYFTNDERFELEGYSLNKGLCVFGGVGVGKTTIMRMFSRNQNQSYIMKMCRAIEDDFSQDGDKTLTQYSVVLNATTNTDPFGHQTLGICFDDLGTEPLSKFYGKDTNVMAEIILNRYDRDLPYNLTHITTNLSINEITSRYGTRATDRMSQMFNLISFPETAKSRRK